MNFEAVTLQSVLPQMRSAKSSEEARQAEKKKSDLAVEDLEEQKEVQPEELLDKIKSLTEDGLYSVRFEMNEEFADSMVVKIVDRETDEVIRQVPAEEILELRQALDDLRGNLVDTEG